MTTKLSVIRNRIKKQRNVELKKLSRKPIQIDQLPTPFPKSNLMHLLELRHGRKIEQLVMTGNIYDLEKKLSIDASTISKWRKLISAARDKEFFDKFSMEGD